MTSPSPPTATQLPTPAARDESVPVLAVTDLVKRYRRRATPANDRLSLTAHRGRVLGVLGHNGAGKTTLANQIVGILRPTSGSISVAGVDAVASPALARSLVSVQPQAAVPITGHTPRSAIEFVGRIRGGTKDGVRHRASELIRQLELDAWADTRAEKLSGGILRLTAFCMAVVEPGALVILDEPSNDVDPERRRLLWAAIRRQARAGTAVLLVTHNITEAAHAIDDLVIVNHGRIIAAGEPAALGQHEAGALTLEIDGVTDPAVLTAFAFAELSPGRHATTVMPGGAPAALAWAERAQATRAISRFSLTPVSLEDTYLALVAADEAEPA